MLTDEERTALCHWAKFSMRVPAGRFPVSFLQEADRRLETMELISLHYSGLITEDGPKECVSVSLTTMGLVLLRLLGDV